MKIIKRAIIACAILLMVAGPTTGTLAASQSTKTDVVTVESVHDGDTFSIKLENEDEKVRILGIDTPELGNKEKFHCLGSEIAQYMKTKIEGKDVTLIRDSIGKNRDSFTNKRRFI